MPRYAPIGMSVTMKARGMGPLSIHDHRRDAAGLTYVYPVLSRRAGGVSVGINLNTNNACNWRCVYCQVPDLRLGAAPPVDLDLLERELRQFLRNGMSDDNSAAQARIGDYPIRDIALSGNGEPTSAREIGDVIALVGRLLCELALEGVVRPRLITNGSLIGRRYVQEAIAALGRLGGEVWFKIDAATPAGIMRVNSVGLEPASVAKRLVRCARLCPTWVQTCLFSMDGHMQSPDELDALGRLVRNGCDASDQVMGVLLYSLARPSLQPEAPRLAALTGDELEGIARHWRTRYGLNVKVSP